MRFCAGPDFGDIDDAGVEIAVLAGDALIDLVGDDVRDAPPVLLRRRIGEAGELLLGEDVPQAELDPRLPSGWVCTCAGDERLRVDLPPVAELRRSRPVETSWMKALRVERLEQAELCRSFDTTPVMCWPSCAVAAVAARSGGIAIGIGCDWPCVMSICSSARAADAAPAAAPISANAPKALRDTIIRCPLG